MTVELKPLTPTIGAELQGVQIGGGLTEAEVDAIHRAVVDWKVVVFRDQDITPDQHVAFGRLFGELEIHPFVVSDTGPPEIVSIHHDETSTRGQDTWHSDVSWRECPSSGAILHAKVVPAVGGDTLFADMEAIYELLDAETRSMLEGRTATHSFLEHFGANMTADEREDHLARHPEQHHPIVRTHPETGRKSLYVNAFFTRCIDGMDAGESDRLLRRLFRTPGDPRVQCRIRWQPGSVAFWDNRSTQHFALFDYHPHTRLVERVSIRGDRPS